MDLQQSERKPQVSGISVRRAWDGGPYAAVAAHAAYAHSLAQPPASVTRASAERELCAHLGHNKALLGRLSFQLDR